MSFLTSANSTTVSGGLCTFNLPTFSNPRGGLVTILIAFSTPTSGLTPSFPSGYSQVDSQLNANSSISFVMCKKVGSVADSGAAIAGGFSGATKQCGVARIYDGVGDVDQHSNTSTNGSGTINIPALPNLQVVNEIIVSFYCIRTNASTVYTAPTGWSNPIRSFFNGNSSDIGSADFVQPTTSQPATTASVVSGGNNSSFAVSITQAQGYKLFRSAGAWVQKPVYTRTAGAWV